MRNVTKAALMGLLLLLSAAPVAAELPADTEVVTGDWQGALYAMYVPAAWNGDLVLYAHGWVEPNLPIALPAGPYLEALRDMLLVDGYAIAYSSYSENGWAVREGFKETDHLLPLFRSTFAPPDRVYVVGQSMGGLVAVMLAEKNHQKVDGALPICGAVGGATMAFDYITDDRVLFDAYYPGIVPGEPLDIPDGIDPIADVFVPALVAMYGDPFRAVELGSVVELGLVAADFTELADSIAIGLWFNVVGTGDLMDRCRGVFFDNSEGYSHPDPPVIDPPIIDEDTLNATVEHYTLDRNCISYLKNWYEPSGLLRIPVLSLHEARDPVVAIKHELEFASRVAANYSSDLLVQRTKDAWGHCENFTAAETKAAFDELVLWVEEGVRPTP